MLLNTNDISVLEQAPAKVQAASEYSLAKRVVDILLSAIGLVLLLPLMTVLALLVKLSSPGPIFFRWHVIGKSGEPFIGYKFRTMFDGAECIRERLREQNEMSGVFFKMKNDPRVTPVGRFLRKFSLDELPQLWSILKGDMSVVGPRPTQIFEYHQLEDWQKERARVKPGSVSLWIVSGKTTDFDRMVELDLKYIRNWSMWLDLTIILRAIPYVLFGRNC